MVIGSFGVGRLDTLVVKKLVVTLGPKRMAFIGASLAGDAGAFCVWQRLAPRLPGFLRVRFSF
ncbi:MAG: hypothetical protein H6882_09610 [Rhodobiaceae bacterium]|nr:hypothetical protein [Rhodobiaceae bacterium]